MAEARKRGRYDSSNGGSKKHKQELDSIGVGSKSKPCTKFFSTSGCPFGENCHFQHHVPGGYNAVAQMMNLTTPLSQSAPPPPQPVPNGSAPPGKTCLCTKYTSPEGCKFGDKCRYAHGEWELSKPVAAPSFEYPHHAMGPPITAHYGSRPEPPPPPRAPPTGFGASATTKISVAAALAGRIIGKGGANSKQICRQTGVKLSIKDHESDPNLRHIELEGTFDQIKIASAMVRDVVASLSAGGPMKAPSATPAHGPASNSYKTKLCDNFSKGSCTFGDKCHFAHGASELRKSVV